MRSRSSYQQTPRLDTIATLIYVALVLIGFISIYSASSGVNGFVFDYKKEYGKQIIWIASAVLLAIVVVFANPNFFEFSAYVIYALTMLLLVAVLLFGREVSGAKSWFGYGGVGIQPSEFAKYGTALALARFLGTYGVRLKGWKNYSIALGFLLIPLALVLKQNDTGSALVFLSFFLVLYREGLPGFLLLLGVYIIALSLMSIAGIQWYLLTPVLAGCAYLAWRNRKSTKLVLLTAAIAIGSVVYTFGVDKVYSKLKPYQRDRIEIILGMKEDNKGAGFNLRQSKIAIGSGQMLGRGFLQGTQTKMGFVPEQHTDFIFCTIGEEWGFVGVLVFFGLYIGLLYRLVIMAERQVSTFGRVFGYSVTSILLIHFSVNIGMTIGLVPVIGIPLPFISFGGSSLWAFTLMFFTFLRIDEARIRYS